MDYHKYCKNKINPLNKASAKRHYFYKEVEAASIDCNIEEDRMNYNTQVMVEAQWAAGTAFSLAPISNMQVAVPCQKGNNPMYVDNDKHIESSKINYLADRANTVYYNVADKLPKQFGFRDDDAPATTQELIDRITSGNYVFKDATKKDAKNYFYRPWENIRWRNPAAKEDQAGLDNAIEQLKKLFQDTKDTIAIGTPAEGLAAVKALDAWTPTVGNA